MRSLAWPLMKGKWCPCTKRKFRLCRCAQAEDGQHHLPAEDSGQPHLGLATKPPGGDTSSWQPHQVTCTPVIVPMSTIRNKSRHKAKTTKHNGVPPSVCPLAQPGPPLWAPTCHEGEGGSSGCCHGKPQWDWGKGRRRRSPGSHQLLALQQPGYGGPNPSSPEAQ
jgi:hypothetical protein